MASSRSARGRPLEPTPALQGTDGSLDSERRVAWLLRVNRIYGHDEKLAVAPPPARTPARWWLDTPDYVLRSALQ
jgi:hypothetical protein